MADTDREFVSSVLRDATQAQAGQLPSLVLTANQQNPDPMGRLLLQTSVHGAT